MKSLKEFILEAKNRDYYSIFDKCKKLKGKKLDKNEANDIIDMIKDYFESNNYEEVSFDEFKKNYKSESVYLFFNDDNYVMCVWDLNNSTFIAATVRYFKNNYYVHGNMPYNPSEMMASISFHFDDFSKMKVWEKPAY